MNLNKFKPYLLLLAFFILLVSCNQNAKLLEKIEVKIGESADTSLKSITVIADGKVFPLEKAFSSEIKNYSAVIPFNTKNFEIKCEANNKNAPIKISKMTELAKEAGAVSLNTVKVTAANNQSEQIYTVQVKRAFPSSDARLQFLGLFAGDILIPFTEEFYPGKTDYKVFLPVTFNKDLTLKAETYSAYSICKDVELKASEFVLPAGEQSVSKTLRIDVTAEDGTVLSYSVNITKKAEEDTIPYLTALKVYNTFAVQINGFFEVYVPLNKTLSDIKNNITIICNPTAQTEITSSDGTDDFNQVDGEKKVLLIKVTLKNAVSQNYKLTLIRKDENSVITKSGNAELTKIEFSVEPENFVIPSIDVTKTKTDFYDISVSKQIKKVGLKVYTEDNKASVSVTPHLKTELAIDVPKDFTIQVTAEDGTIKQTIVKLTKTLNGLVKVLDNEVTVPQLSDIPWLNEGQKRNYVFTGAFYENDVSLKPFEIGMYEVTYKLWYDVRIKAEANGYVFANKGCEGSDTGKLVDNLYYQKAGKTPSSEGQFQPVTAISYRDMVVWCNAYSYLNDLEPVYWYKGEPIKSAVANKPVPHPAAEGMFLYYFYADAAVAKENANGFRLPSQAEWEFAARGGDMSKPEWNFAYPGVKGYEDGKPIMLNQDYAKREIADYVWYFENAKVDSIPQAHEVGEKLPNSLGIYDLGGNVYEMCSDIKPYINEKDPRDDMFVITLCGGSYQSSGLFAMQVSKIFDTGYTETKSKDYGFRVARSIIR